MGLSQRTVWGRFLRSAPRAGTVSQASRAGGTAKFVALEYVRIQAIQEGVWRLRASAPKLNPKLPKPCRVEA